MMLKDIFYFIDIVLSYLTIHLGRCAAFSFLMMILIMAGRKRVPQKDTFIKGLCWSLLIITPFMGRLNMFWDQRWCLKMTNWWTDLCKDHLWVGKLYFAGIFICLLIFRHTRKKAGRFIKELDKMQIAGTDVYVCPHTITPFTTGVIKSKIVFPEKMLETYGEQELRLILLHEKTHVRIGHLVFYMLWDILHALFWVNPLFFRCRNYFKEDMEDICDRITIQSSGSTGYEYGKLLLKSIRLLQSGSETHDLNRQFAFVGENQYQRIRERVVKAASFKTYNVGAVYGMIAAFIFLILASMTFIFSHSYARYEELDEVSVVNAAGRKILLNDGEELRAAVSYDEDFLYIDSERFAAILEKEHVSDHAMFVCFGGFYKIPGYGGGINCIYVDKDMLQEKCAKVPYKSSYTPDIWLLKVI